MVFGKSSAKEGGEEPKKCLYQRFQDKKTGRDTVISDEISSSTPAIRGQRSTNGQRTDPASQGTGLQARWPWGTRRDWAGRRRRAASVGGALTPGASQSTRRRRGRVGRKVVSTTSRQSRRQS
ncbi:hypothetical protein CSOJ01_02386 [Colletotrichum sojae]|uniref:Uncharacterized protein n=1 Tax=Colletotrichum sojae TaxID=2175907 RepID=A0A8H6JQE0_9PEZI|nr:hypothetical protein CSOJ01_02386 [Colletotrichum sojae]